MKPIMKPSKQRGVAAVELALILPVMLILVFGITELGRALYQYNGLVKATRGAVRYLSQYDLANEDVTKVRNNTIKLAVFGAPLTCTDTKQLECTYPTTPLVTGLTEAQVRVYDYLNNTDHQGVLTGQGTVDLVTVRIGAPGTVFTFSPLISYVLPSDITFSPIQTTMASRYF